MSNKVEKEKSTESLRKVIREELQNTYAPAPALSLEQSIEQPAVRPKLVKFDQQTSAPFEAKFSERGFDIDGTRLSFEEIEHALNKNYIIKLNTGFELTPVRMQQIMKYKNMF